MYAARSFVVAALSLVALAASPAHAEDRDAFVTLTSLGASYMNDDVVVELGLDGKSWTWLTRQRIPVVVRAEARLAGGKTAAAKATLSGAQARLVIDLPAGEVEGVDVSFEGDNGTQAIGSFRIGGLDLVRARLKPSGVRVAAAEPAPVRDDVRQAAPPVAAPAAVVNWASVPAVIRACSKTESKARCLGSVKAARIDPTRAITSCAATFDWEGEQTACLDLVTRLGYEASPLVDACAASFDFAADRLTCLSVATTATADPSKVIRACHDGDPWSADVHACIRQALGR